MSGLDSSTPSSNVRSNGFPTEGHPSPSGSQSSEGIPPTDGYGPVGTVPVVPRDPDNTPANNTGVTTAALSTPITGFDMSNPPHTQFSDAPPPADSVIRSLANSLQQIQTQNGPRRAASVPVTRETIHVNGLPHPHGLDGLHLTNQSHTSSGPPSGSLPPPPPPEHAPYFVGGMYPPSQSAVPYPPPPGYPPSNHGLPMMIPSQEGTGRFPVPFPINTNLGGRYGTSQTQQYNAPSTTVPFTNVPPVVIALSEEDDSEHDSRPWNVNEGPNSHDRFNSNRHPRHANVVRSGTSGRQRESRPISTGDRVTEQTAALGSHGPTDNSVQVGEEGVSANGNFIKVSGKFRSGFFFNVTVENDDNRSTSRHQPNPPQVNTARTNDDTVMKQAPPEIVTAGGEVNQCQAWGFVFATLLSMVAFKTLSLSSLDSKI
ncbi:hypothetical protein M231_02017 [Tremella mesenterica]|uniref:Uncharacterized protein n=1 Tax=Tremella mesenterica TaxID=5217 RepID=A0A4Q1BS01_TREME|nr:hypothetical protein M231_02017 [Tremella mesenterica]